MLSTRDRLRPVVTVGCLLACAALSPAAQPRLVPPPREVRWSDAEPLKLDRVAIVLGDRATDPERCAADLLRRLVTKRFGVEWGIIGEQENSHATTLIMMGTSESHGSIDAACRQANVKLGRGDPGTEGYIIDTVELSGRTVVLAAGSDPRGVIGAGDTLFQLLDRAGDSVVMHRAAIRDVPSIRWRGRPQTSVGAYLRPGEWDLYMMARINYIDLRSGIYAFEAGEELPAEQIRQVIGEAHRRDILVYGTVNCGVPASRHPAVMKTFRELLELGAGGLWISFDDKGPGEQPHQLIVQVLELGRQHGITGNRIVVTPPKGAYQDIPVDFARTVLKIPGMEEAIWLWSCVPTPDQLAAARSVGLKSRLGWWHNWTRPTSGFGHVDGSNLSNEARRPYMEVPTMAVGWHAPDDDMLRTAGAAADSIMPWGGNAWGQFYIVPVIGWWGWHPEGHDFEAVRDRIYGYVFGPGQARAARHFDDTLASAKRLFEYGSQATSQRPLCPARLKREEDRAEALKLFDRLDGLLGRLSESAPRQTMLSLEELEGDYLAPMRTEIGTGRVACEAPYPEYWWTEHQRRLLAAVHGGRDADANRMAAEVRGKVTGDVSRIGESLRHLRPTKGYVEWWKRIAGLDAAGWRRTLAERKRLLKELVWDYAFYIADRGEMLAGADKPPLDWGTGRWERSNKLIATALPSPQEMWWGNWLAGLHPEESPSVAVFAVQRKTCILAGDFVELPVEFPLHGQRERLAMLVYVANVNKQDIGLQFLDDRWAGYRSLQILQGDAVLWDLDVGCQRAVGEWHLVKLPSLPAKPDTLHLTLRVIEHRDGQSNYGQVLVAPIRLIQLGE